MKKLIINLSLSLFSILFFLLLLEFVVFRFIFPSGDIAIPTSVNNVVRFQAGQTGTYRVKNEIKADFKINANGWNSKYAEYDLKKSPNKYRVAIIGDSYIAGYQVDYRKSVAEQLESKLGEKSEVYRFGIDGAPLSQYLHMLRHEVLNYKPDLVVINLVHNDFKESYSLMPGVFMSSFLKYEIKDGHVAKEIPPQKYTPPWYSWIREKSAIWKFLSYRQQVHFGALRRLILGSDDDAEYQANIDVSTIDKDAKDNMLITRYTFRKVKKLCHDKGIELIILMDGDDRVAIKHVEQGKDAKDMEALKLNRLAIKAADLEQVKLINLHTHFEQDYAIHRHRFTFLNDGHWNEYTHNLVANILSNAIKKDLKPVLLLK